MFELSDKQFNTAHSKAAGEGDEYINSLAVLLASVLTKAGIKINGQTLINNLNSIAEEEGMEAVQNAELLKTRLDLKKIIELVNPEDIYRAPLMQAYILALTMSVTHEQVVPNLIRNFSIAFKKEGKDISEEQITAQLPNMINYQKIVDTRNNDFYNPEKSASNVFTNPEDFIKNLCIHLQLAGFLD